MTEKKTATNGKAPTALSRDAILAIEDRRVEYVAVPEWGGGVHVRSLTGSERDAFEASVVGERKDNKLLNYRNMRARLLVRCVVDANGEALFTERDVAKLGEKNAHAIDRVFSVAQRLSGLSDDDLEVLTDNLKNDQSGDSISA